MISKSKLILLLCLLPTICGAQDFGRWSVETTGSIGFGYAPKYSAGVQTVFDIFKGESFRIGVGTGIRLAKPLCLISREGKHTEAPSAVYLYSGDGDKVYTTNSVWYAPVFLSAGWYPMKIGDKIHPFVRLDGGYFFNIGRGDETNHLTGPFLEPSVGVFFNGGFYVDFGAWLQRATRVETNRFLNPDGSLLQANSNSYRSLVSSISMRVGVRF